ncbi:MAG: glycosyltransferase [Usitatibacter sp.]
MAPEEYRRNLVAPLAPPPTAAAIPKLPPGIWFRPAHTPIPVSLKDLYETGIESGHGETRAHLKLRVARYDYELDLANAQLRNATAEIARAGGERVQLRRELEDIHRLHEQHSRDLEAAIAAARARIRDFEESTFWKASAPLRYIAHKAKELPRSARRIAHQTRLIPPRLGTARSIARDQGLVELLRRVGAKVTKRAARSAGIHRRAGLESRIEALHVPASDAPKVTVIVPTFGQDLHTFTCLKAVAAEAAVVPLEVLVMDDCAPVAAADALKGVTGVRFERNAQNLGFLRNCNRAATLARGEYLLFLNNDAVLEPGSIAALLRVLEGAPDVGIAGAKLVYPDGRLQEAGGILWRDGSAWNVGRGEDPDRPEHNYVRDVDYCSGACLLIAKSLFEANGGFDELYLPAYYEDADLCLKVRAAGKRVVYQPAAEAVHFEGVSHGVDTASGVKRHQVDNQSKLQQRWKSVLQSHRVNGVLPRLERDRDAKHRVLLVEACMLTPDHDAGSVRTWKLIEVMQRLGAKVTFVAANLEHREPYVGRLQQAGVEVLYAPYVTSIDALIEERGVDFDIIILARYYVAAPHIDAVRRHAPRALLVLDTIDLHYLRQRRLAALEKSSALAQGAQKTHQQEIDCIQRSDVTWVVSEVERDILSREVPSARVLVQSLIHDLGPRRNGFGERAGLLFVGGFRHPPNIDAALWYVGEIAPLLAEMLPGVTTHFIGSNAPRAILDLQAPGIDVVGYVPDLEPWLERCRVSVSPLRYGAGMKGKVIESMSHGLPVVATAMSVEGMRLAPDKEAVMAEEPRAFAEAVARLYRDEGLWNRVSQSARDHVKDHFSREVAAEGLGRLFEISEHRRRG